MVDLTKLLSKMSNSSLTVSPELLSLSYAICAHAALLSPMHSHMEDMFYQQSRKYLDQAEVRDSGSFKTISALQTCILLALYELKRTLFARAWVSVSRATWLAQMIELGKMDCNSASKPKSQSSEPILPVAADAMELEERRQTFWGVFNLNCYASIGIGWRPNLAIEYSDVSAPLNVFLIQSSYGSPYTIHSLPVTITFLWRSLRSSHLARFPRTFQLSTF